MLANMGDAFLGLQIASGVSPKKALKRLHTISYSILPFVVNPTHKFLGMEQKNRPDRTPKLNNDELVNTLL